MATESVRLQRSLNLWQVTSAGIGIVIGAGIYVLIGTATAQAGSLVWLSFVLAAVLGGVTGLSYAELAGLFPSAGAEYEFSRRAFNEFWGFLTGWLMIAGNVVAAGAVPLGFAQYLRNFVDVDVRIGAVGLLAALALVVLTGVRRSIWITTTLVLLQIGGLVLVATVGFPHVGDRPLFEGTPSGVIAGAALVFFAFIGFDEVVTLSDETKDPSRVIPRALLLALGISTLLYVGVGIAAVSVVDWRDIASSERPLALVISHDWGTRAGDIVSLIALASTTNTTLLVLTAASRLIYDMGQKGALPHWLGHINRRTHSPDWAVLVAVLVAAGFALSGRIGLVAAVTNFSVYAVFISVNLAVLRLRRTHPHLPRPIAAGNSSSPWPLLPIVGLIVTVIMTLFLEATAWLIGAAVVVIGLLVWRARLKQTKG
jgi:APA family basic amino acid/polyamine antiporter